MATCWRRDVAPRGSASFPSRLVPADPLADDSSAVSEGPSDHASTVEPANSEDTEHPAPVNAEAPAPPPPHVPPVIDVLDLDWERIAMSVAPGALRARMRETVEQFETL